MGRVRSRSETASGKRPAPARSNRTGTGERGGKPDARLPLAAASKRRNGLPRSGTGRGRREAGDEDGAAGDEDGHSPREKARAYRAKKLEACGGGRVVGGGGFCNTVGNGSGGDRSGRRIRLETSRRNARALSLLPCRNV